MLNDDDIIDGDSLQWFNRERKLDLDWYTLDGSNESYNLFQEMLAVTRI